LNDPTTTFGQLPSAEKKTIADAVEQQVKWLDLNPTAKIDELLVHKKQLQQVVIRIITNVNSEFVHSNDTD
jgi:predicted Ser/Thr protein kinase